MLKYMFNQIPLKKWTYIHIHLNQQGIQHDVILECILEQGISSRVGYVCNDIKLQSKIEFLSNWFRSRSKKCFFYVVLILVHHQTTHKYSKG